MWDRGRSLFEDQGKIADRIYSKLAFVPLGGRATSIGEVEIKEKMENSIREADFALI